MLKLRNGALALLVAEDASRIVIEDKLRATAWELSSDMSAYCRAGREVEQRQIAGKMDVSPTPLAGGRASAAGDTIEVSYDSPDGGAVRYTWSLGQDHAKVNLAVEADDLAFVSMPGAFVPAKGAHEVLVPILQGLLVRRCDRHWRRSSGPGGHAKLSMAMVAVLADTGGLLLTVEHPADWIATIGNDEELGPFAALEERACSIDGWYDREVRIYPTGPGISPPCRRYRERVKERGEFVSWDEKIERKPIVQDLFGSLMAFVGYNSTDEIDYVDSARRLRESGFDSVFYYPVRVCQYSLDFKMGGDDPIWLSDETIAAMKAVEGTHLSPWAWVNEALDDGSDEFRRMYRRSPSGEPVPHWTLDDYTWNWVCTPYQIEHMKKRFEADMSEMDWVHYDVTATSIGRECYSREHPEHGGRPMSRRQELEWTLRLLGPETVGNRVVSSEGFVDRFTPSYDIGSTKVIPQWGDYHCIPVPMTMLVFHDSTIHDWWEVHNYNDHGGFSVPQEGDVGVNGCGLAEKKAAMDALYGSPPNLFPFGKQYSWIDIKTRETYSYLVRIDDAEVQRAIRAALPVARLHKRIGPCDLQGFEFLTDDYAVQATEFSDGTRIVANISDGDREIDSLGTVAADSWREIG